MDTHFRYLSPVLLIRKSDRRAVGLHSAAVTTKPAIPRMERQTVVDRAKGEYADGGKSLHKLCDLKAYANRALQEAGLGALNTVEVETLAV